MQPLKPAMKRSLEKAVAQYETALPGSPAETYLTGRGLHPDTVERFRLGYVAHPRPGHEQYAGMLAIPSIGHAGVVSLRFRCIEPHDCKELGHGKYQSLPGVETRMFNSRAIVAAGDMIAVLEGEIDAISVEEAGIPAVAVSGANSWKRHYARMLAGFDQVIIPADAGAVGARFAQEVSLALQQGGRIVALDGVSDANEYLQMFGPEALYRALTVDEDEE